MGIPIRPFILCKNARLVEITIKDQITQIDGSQLKQWIYYWLQSNNTTIKASKYE